MTLLKAVIIYDSGARISFEEIQAHPFFNKRARLDASDCL